MQALISDADFHRGNRRTSKWGATVGQGYVRSVLFAASRAIPAMSQGHFVEERNRRLGRGIVESLKSRQNYTF